MIRAGIASRDMAALLNAMREHRMYWDRTFRYFGRSSPTQMQSINRKLEEYYDMAVKAKKGIAAVPKKETEFSWKGFIDVKLTDTDKANYAAWDVQDADVWDGVAQYVEAGIKIALSYNNQNASYTCAGTGQPSSGANNGYCITAHAKSPYDAVRVWLYKVSNLVPPTWTEYDAGDVDSIG